MKVGFRAWAVQGDSLLSVSRLSDGTQDVWPADGFLEAVCRPEPAPVPVHEVPGKTHDCGIYIYLKPEYLLLPLLTIGKGQELVFGRALGEGRIEPANLKDPSYVDPPQRGWRVERARPCALFSHGNDEAERLAEIYHVPTEPEPPEVASLVAELLVRGRVPRPTGRRRRSHQARSTSEPHGAVRFRGVPRR